MLYSRKFRYRRLSFSRTLCKQTLQKANADSGISMVTKGLGAIGIIESLIGVGLGIGSMIGIRPKFQSIATVYFRLLAANTPLFCVRSPTVPSFS